MLMTHETKFSFHSHYSIVPTRQQQQQQKMKELNSDITSFYARIASEATELDNDTATIFAFIVVIVTYMCAHVCNVMEP